jgi:hypothetical protein
MAKLIMTVELDIDDEMYGDDEEKSWLLNDILTGDKGQLLLHSNEIGDTVGAIKVLSVHFAAA